MFSIFSTLFVLYFFFLVIFSLISHPVYYCVLLVLNALVCSFICYAVYGFGWYSLLFCLVYIGGVYILFIFVSVHNPNSNVFLYWGFGSLSLFVFFCLIGLIGFVVYYISISEEYSSYLCTLAEGPFYLCMCLTLLFGFVVLSLIMSVKINHYR